MYTVLAIVCHPDDMEFFCSGTLLACKERGDRVVVCNLCNGDLGHMEIKPKELSEIRLREAEASCELVGFEHLKSPFSDLQIYDGNIASVNRVVEIIRYADPDFIITHHPDDYMADHVATANLTVAAARAACNPAYAPDIKGKARPMPIYHMQPEVGFRFCPTEFVDIGRFLETRIKMLMCHKSQYEWLEAHDNIDCTEELRTTSRNYGLQCGCEYAEGFELSKQSPYRSTKRFLP